jgi:opacity protein-like surface antigen
MKHTNILISTACAALLVASSAAAQEVPDPVQPAPTAPAPLPPEAESFNVTPVLGFGLGGDLENTPATFGAALGYGFNDRWSVEGELAFTPGGEQGILTEFDTSIWTLSANVLYHFTTENFSPYVTGGIGFMGADADEADIPDSLDVDGSSNEFALNWGGGIKTAMNQNWGLRADLRFFNGDDFAPDHWRLYGGVVIRRIGE